MNIWGKILAAFLALLFLAVGLSYTGMFITVEEEVLEVSTSYSIEEELTIVKATITNHGEITYTGVSTVLRVYNEQDTLMFSDQQELGDIEPLQSKSVQMSNLYLPNGYYYFTVDVSSDQATVSVKSDLFYSAV